jgi:hypothetical protein
MEIGFDGGVLADMNGPLGYWGPAARTAPPSDLTPAERIALLRLRDRLAAGRDASLGESIGEILAFPSLAGAR